MTTLKFKCKLLSDVILNQKAATEGPNQTLDFIPGSCFLGIVANKLYKDMNETTMEIFHSGKVRFGDAHPSSGNVRGLKVPASMFYPKLMKPYEELYIYHLIPDTILNDSKFKEKQIKQCRNGFYTFVGDQANEVKTETNFAIKSAYDKNMRRSKDEQMYGYQSLQKGLVLYFEVEVDNDVLSEDIEKALVGEKRVGRSRTAQYGLVEISKENYSDVQSSQVENNIVTVYADGRLIFLDDYGLPTFRPSVTQLGLPDDATICWEKSQIRTFQYAPWNFQRQCFDADRCGIEKGSVFVVNVTNCKLKELKSQYIGSYNNEGFGKVIYNPEFLKGDKDGNAKFGIKKDEPDNPKQQQSSLSGTKLLDYIGARKHEEDVELDVYARVNAWVEANKSKFKGDVFASQWNAIRSIAMKHKSLKELQDVLFLKMMKVQKVKKDGTKEEIEKPNAYLTHGVAADKWGERGRLNAFKQFVNELTDENAQIAIINLAAEMAKKCKEDK